MKTHFAAALLAVSLSLAGAAPALAQDEEAIPPAALEQIHLAQRLADLGEARKDPVLLTAAARLMKTLDKDGAAYGEPIDVKSALDKARSYAGENAELINLIDDIEAETDKGYYYCPPHRYSCS